MEAGWLLHEYCSRPRTDPWKSREQVINKRPLCSMHVSGWQWRCDLVRYGRQEMLDWWKGRKHIYQIWNLRPMPRRKEGTIKWWSVRVGNNVCLRERRQRWEILFSLSNHIITIHLFFFRETNLWKWKIISGIEHVFKLKVQWFPWGIISVITKSKAGNEVN